MKFEKLKSEGLHREYDVVLLADEIEKAVVDKLKQRVKTFKMHGFRQGHVPLQIVRKHIEDEVTAGVLKDLIFQSCSEIEKQDEIVELATRPVYKLKKQYEKGQDVELVLYFDTAPSFELKPYSFEIEKVVPNVSEEDVDATLKKLIMDIPACEDADDDYVIKANDEVSYYVTRYNNGVEDKKKSFSDTVMVKDTEDNEFAAKFIGKKKGDIFEIEPTEDKNIKNQIKVVSVKKALLDISPDEYAKRHGFESLKVMKEIIKQNAENQINDLAFVYHKYQILDKLASEYKFEMPQVVLQKEMDYTFARAKREQELQARKDPQIKKESDEELQKDLEEVVHKRCLLGYVLNKIADREHITVTDDDTVQEIIKEVKRSPEHKDMIINFYKNNSDAYAYKKAEALESKIVKFLIEKATQKDVKKNRKEMTELMDKILEI